MAPFHRLLHEGAGHDLLGGHQIAALLGPFRQRRRAHALCAGCPDQADFPEGEREIDLTGLYRDDGIDYLGMRPGEILTRIDIPADSDREHCRSAFWKLRRRGSIDFSVLSVAVALWMNDRNVVDRAAIWLGAVGSSPVCVRAAEDLLVGKTLDEDLIAAVAHRARKDATPLNNTDFVAAWRGKMAEHYTHAALCDAAGLPVRRQAPKHGLTVV